MKKIIPIILGIVIVIGISAFAFYGDSSEPQQKSIYEEGFTFNDIDKIRKSLSTQKIFMSSPTEITDNTIGQYCPSIDGIQHPINHCATTAMTDIGGNTFGNFNMGGTTDGPIMAVAVIDSTPLLDSKKSDIGYVFETMIEKLVCDCWAQKQPGGFESVQSWIDAAESKFAVSSQSTPLQSNIEGLEGLNLVLKIRPTNDGYLWTLYVLK